MKNEFKGNCYNHFSSSCDFFFLHMYVTFRPIYFQKLAGVRVVGVTCASCLAACISNMQFPVS